MLMQVLTEITELGAAHGGVFVPTMGALHEGHLSLVRRAAELGGPVVVSIFVNPTQFGPNEDYSRYPRDLDRDVEAAAEAGAELVFAPGVETVYPADGSVVAPDLPAVARTPGLEDAMRPGHFEGVCQVVARLFDLVRPAHAIFGEKDYQQLMVLRAMVDANRARWGDLVIESGTLVRDDDGLALSSRNRYLGADQRDRALGLFRALRAARAADSVHAGEAIMHDTLRAHDLAIDYAVLRDAETLMPTERFAGARGLIAARLDDVRLIDTMAMPS